MPRIRTVPLSVGLLASALLALTAPPAHAQADKPQPVNITTADKVTLSAHFYPGARGAGAPVVILLHAFNEDSSKAEWQALASTLQKAGYAVMRFDFRGFGNSTSVEPGDPYNRPLPVRGFWDEKENAAYVRGAYVKGTNKRATSIDAKNFTPSYYRILANDIEAVKAWLDASGQCDTSKTVLIGAKEGATVGALWLNAAWSCYRLVPDPQGFQPVPDVANPEGAKVKAAVWLSVSSSLGTAAQGKISANVPSMLYKAAAQQKTPMLFFYGDGDSTGRTTAVNCEKQLTRGDKKKYPLTAKVPVPKAGKIAGSALLADTLGLQRQLPAYLDSALAAQAGKVAAGKMAAGPNDPYVWLVPGLGGRVQPQPARNRGMPIYYNFASFWH